MELATRGNRGLACYTDHILRYGDLYNSTLRDDDYFYMLVDEARGILNVFGVNILPQHQKRGLGTKLLQIGYTLGSVIGRSEFCIDYTNPMTQATVAKANLKYSTFKKGLEWNRDYVLCIWILNKYEKVNSL